MNVGDVPSRAAFPPVPSLDWLFELRLIAPTPRVGAR
jgi:hypothetical protein